MHNQWSIHHEATRSSTATITRLLIHDSSRSLSSSIIQILVLTKSHKNSSLRNDSGDITWFHYCQCLPYNSCQKLESPLGLYSILLFHMYLSNAGTLDSLCPLTKRAIKWPFQLAFFLKRGHQGKALIWRWTGSPISMPAQGRDQRLLYRTFIQDTADHYNLLFSKMRLLWTNSAPSLLTPMVTAKATATCGDTRH